MHSTFVAAFALAHIKFYFSENFDHTTTEACIVLSYSSLGGGRSCFYRPPIDHRQNLLNFTFQINIRIVRHFQTFGKGIAQRLAKVLPNVWQRYCPTFGKSVFQRLAKMFSNVLKISFQRLIKELSNV